MQSLHQVLHALRPGALKGSVVWWGGVQTLQGDPLDSSPGMATSWVVLVSYFTFQGLCLPKYKKEQQHCLPNRIFIEIKRFQCLRHSKHSTTASFYYTFFYDVPGILKVSQQL